MTIPEFNNQQAYPTTPAAKRDSTLAIISLITGILGWTILPFISSIVAVITGHLAKKEIRESGGTMAGDGMALAGLILGYTMIGLSILLIILVIAIIVGLVPWFQSTLTGFSGLLALLG